MATGPDWTNKATHALIGIWGQSDVQSSDKLSAKKQRRELDPFWSVMRSFHLFNHV